MKNALKYFKNVNRLKFKAGDVDSIRCEFHETAQLLLNECYLMINDHKYRICEIEFYLYGADHLDPYVHCHPDQNEFGGWYFHRTQNTRESGFRGGKFKGLDLALGSQDKFVGILIRRIENFKDRRTIDGPSLVVDEILAAAKCESIKQFLESKTDLNLVLDETLESKAFFYGPRVGLSANRDKTFDFFFAPYRYGIDLKNSSKRKHHYLLHYYEIFGKLPDNEHFEVSPSIIQKWLDWFNEGKNQNLESSSNAFNDTVETFCKLFGSYFATKNIQEVTPEELLKMAIQSFRDGDWEHLGYLCDVGIQSCEENQILKELFKLRGIYNASTKDLLKAKQDFLRALELDPEDDVVLTNFITSCIQSGDRLAVSHGLRGIYSTLSGDRKFAVLESLAKGIKNNAIEVEDLPEVIIGDLHAFIKKPHSA